MPETVQGGNATKPPKEISMEIRLLLAFLLMGVVMFVTPYIIKSTSPPANNKAASAQKSAPAEKKAAAPAQPSSAQQAVEAQPSPASAASAAETPQRPLPSLVIQTDLYRVMFTNHGATAQSWQLTKYKGNDKKPLELVNTAAGLNPPFSLHLPGKEDLAQKINWAYYDQTVDPDGLGVTYSYSDGETSVRKSFRFKKDSYISTVLTEVTANGRPVSNMITWRGGFGDLTVANPAGTGKAVYFNVAENKLVEENAGAAKSGPVSTSGNYSFAGLADNYFAAVFLPQGNATVRQTIFSNTVRTALEAKQQPFVGVAVSDGEQNRFDLFVGPKDLDILNQINPKLQGLVDFGWMGFLAKPLFLITNWLDNAFVHNYGWSIVVVTVILNFLLFPLKLSNMKSMKKMQALKPQIEVINQKYKNVSLRDPRKAEQNQEVMALYKKNGVNPMGGCFPMLIQIPFFFAFYKVFTVAVEMRGASWLWVSDLSQPEQIAIRILPIAMIVSQFLMQKMTPQPAGDPNQQKMMLFMPLIFGFMFYNFPSGLVLYYLTSNLVSIGQQAFFNHTAIADAAARSVEPVRKKIGRK